MARTSHSSAWTPPPQFDGFTLLGPLGSGGMGQVFLAREEALDREVAIKCIAGELARPESRARFLREARALARVEHPNVVRIYRLGTVEDRPYIAYERVRGQPLDGSVARRDGWRDALEVGRQLARGLGAVHRAGVLHRDVKPSNVLRTEEGRVKLIDFGLAAFLDAEEALPHGAGARGATAPPERHETHDEHDEHDEHEGHDEHDEHEGQDDWTVTLERAGTSPPVTDSSPRSLLRGTPHYMAPELWRGEPSSVASDLFALGLVLYELTGVTVPRAAAADGAIPSLAAAHDAIPAALAAVVDRCLEPDPAARFASADALGEALDAIDAAPTEDDPAAIRSGADTVARSCLGAREGDAVALISWGADEEADLLAEALRRLEAIPRRLRLDDRPTEGALADVDALLGDVELSVLVARHGLPPAISMAVLEAVRRDRLVHLHLTRVARALFAQSYRAEPVRIAERNARARAAFERAEALEVTSDGGTALTASLSPEHPFLSSDGRPGRARPDNLPSGFVSFHPADVTGRFVADRLLLGALRVGPDELGGAPLELTFEGGRVVEARSADRDIERRVAAYLESHENAGRVGMLVFPTNHTVREESGLDVQDALLPGLGVGLGYSNAEATKATFSCPVQLRLFARRPTVRVAGGPTLVERGRDVWLDGPGE